MNISIIQEQKEDNNVVINLVKEAFLKMEYSDEDEHNLVKRLHDSTSFIPELSLVAKIDKTIVGYILATEIKIGDKIELAIAPIAVHPQYQGLGIGSKLINSIHEKASKLNYSTIVILGDYKYYNRFGYDLASKLMICPPFEVPEEYFLARNISSEKVEYSNNIVKYAREFNI